MSLLKIHKIENAFYVPLIHLYHHLKLKNKEKNKNYKNNPTLVVSFNRLVILSENISRVSIFSHKYYE